MEITNNNLVSIYKAIEEICNSLELKKELKDAYKVIYAACKTRGRITKHYEKLAVTERDLALSYNNAVVECKTDIARINLKNQFDNDVKDLFNQTVDIEIYTIDDTESNTIIKYLTGESTFAYLQFLTTNTELNG